MPLEYQRGSVFLTGKRCKNWYAKYRVWHQDPTTGAWTVKQKTKKIGPKSGLTKFEARERLHALIAAECGPQVRQTEKEPPASLNDFVNERYAPLMSCRETTKRKILWEIKRYLLERFGARPLTSIGLFDLQIHLNELAKTFSHSVVRHTFTNIRSIFNCCVDLELLDKSPARRLKMPDTREPNRDTITAQQIMLMLRTIEHPMDRCAFAIGVFCALRTAELFGLRWESWVGNKLNIKDTAFEGRLQTNKLKTAASRGAVPIPDLVRPIIEEWYRCSAHKSPLDLVFSTNGKKHRKGQRVPFDSTNFMERRIHPVADRLIVLESLAT